MSLCLLMVAGTTILAPISPSAQAAAPRPNVLNIVLDDMRDQSQAQVRTYMPKTVQWFTSGTFFSAADVSTPSCCPARAAGMTGQYDHNNHMMHQHDVAAFDTATTVQHFLRLGGYQTAMVGKYLHEWPLAEAPPDFGRYAMWQVADYNNPTVNVMGTISTLSGYSTTLAGNYALRYLKAMTADPQGRPWYEYVAIHAPHPDGNGNFVAEAKYAAAPVPTCGLAQPGEANLSDKPPYAKAVKVDNARVQNTCQNQMRVLMSVDDQIDRLMTYLQSSGQLANTLVILWSDNGTMWGEHNRVSKFVPYLPSINVPIWVRWDGQVPAGTNNTLVSNVDLAPTIYQATGVHPAASVTLDGHSLLAPVTRTVEFNEYWLDTANGNVPTWAQVHDTHFSYIETFDAAGAVTFREYYNLDSDPGQLTNTLKDGDASNDPTATRLAALHEQVGRLRTCVGATCP